MKNWGGGAISWGMGDNWVEWGQLCEEGDNCVWVGDNWAGKEDNRVREGGQLC